MKVPNKYIMPYYTYTTKSTPLFYKYTYHGEAVNGDQSTNMTLKSPVSKNAKKMI